MCVYTDEIKYIYIYDIYKYLPAHNVLLCLEICMPKLRIHQAHVHTTTRGTNT